MASFFYDSEDGNWNFTSIVRGVRPCSLEFLPFNIGVFLNGYLHIMGHSGEYPMILAVDMEGNTWRKIDGPSGLQHSMHQAQGYLCVCIVGGPNDSKLSI
jgi:hypothetical protein